MSSPLYRSTSGRKAVALSSNEDIQSTLLPSKDTTTASEPSSDSPQSPHSTSPPTPLALGSKSRSTSYSLLSGSNVHSPSGRKGFSLEAEQVVTHSDKASISMPPPNAKPAAADRKLSGTRDARPLSALEVLQDGSFLPDPTQTPRRAAGDNSNKDSHRISFSSISSNNYISLGANVLPSTATSSAAASYKSTMDPSSANAHGDPMMAATTAMDTTTITTSSHLGSSLPSPHSLTTKPVLNFTPTATPHHTHNASSAPAPRETQQQSKSESRQQGKVPGRSASRTPRRLSGSTAASSASEVERMRSPSREHGMAQTDPDTTARPFLGYIGVCALDSKARSKPSMNILTRLQAHNDFKVIIFGDKAILDEDVENWPLCDYLISFFSDGFPLDKAIAYVKLRKPFCVNDLPMQKVLWDRRLCLSILDRHKVNSPKRVLVTRDGGPKLESPELATHVYDLTRVKLEGPSNGTGGGLPKTKSVTMSEDGNAIIVDGVVFKKPFVEKPVSGEDHNIHIYYPKKEDGSGGGGRRLFRKIGNKSSEYEPDLILPRSITEPNSSYVYEQFLQVDNAEDVKAYTVGKSFCHAETRKSPAVDGVVRRNTHGKEMRYVTKLNRDETLMAQTIASVFGQRICGFDLLRVGDASYVIDVNGWSFVKDNVEYYDRCAEILKEMFSEERRKRLGGVPEERVSSENNSAAESAGRRQSHRQALKGIISKPSMSSMSKLHHSHRAHGTTSPDIGSSTTPITSPPSLDKRAGVALGTTIPREVDSTALLPPPVIPPTAPSSALPTPAIDQNAPMPAAKHSWNLKGMVSVIRHADRTPKQKFKFTFHSQPFVDLLNGHHEEVVIKGEAALASVENAVKIAMEQGLEDMEKLKLLRTSLIRKGGWQGTKVQIKPMFRKRKPEELRPGESPEEALASSLPREVPNGQSMDTQVEANEGDSQATRMTNRSDSVSGVTFSRFSAAENDLILDKLQLVIKWGGEPTHASRYQASELGLNMRNDIKLLNKEILDNVCVYTSSEPRVSTSAQIWTSAFVDRSELPSDFISVRKDLLDDSNAAKDVMDKVKKKLKLLLREGNSAPPQFAWPANLPEPSIVLADVVELMKLHRSIMHQNFKTINSSPAAAALANIGEGSEGGQRSLRSSSSDQNISSVQGRWCTGEDPELFRERWEKLFKEFCDSEKVDPSKISELYDTMKYDALHNRAFLEWAFRPSDSMLEAMEARDLEKNAEKKSDTDQSEPAKTESARTDTFHSEKSDDKSEKSERPSVHAIAHRIGFRRRSVYSQTVAGPLSHDNPNDSYFKLYTGQKEQKESKAKLDLRLVKLKELYKLAKVLYDYVCPQEYGLTDEEKLEIGLLTSLPLLREIVSDLENLQEHDEPRSFVYFTKESHIYTLLNCILEGGIQTKIARSAIPEMDYLSQICFELYEARDEELGKSSFSIRITITPGCHTSDPLDVEIDSKHAIGCAPRRSLTAHQDWKTVIETLKAKLNAVKLPQSFLAVNVSEMHAAKYRQKQKDLEKEHEELDPEELEFDPTVADQDSTPADSGELESVKL